MWIILWDILTKLLCMFSVFVCNTWQCCCFCRTCVIRMNCPDKNMSRYMMHWGASGRELWSVLLHQYFLYCHRLGFSELCVYVLWKLLEYGHIVVVCWIQRWPDQLARVCRVKATANRATVSVAETAPPSSYTKTPVCCDFVCIAVHVLCITYCDYSREIV